MPRLAAIDPGITGAIAVLETGAVYFYDMPVLTARNGKSRVDAQALGRILDGCDEVAIEEVSAMPGQGLSSTFGFGYSAGVCAGVCGALEIPVRMVRPQKWKATFGLIGSDKDFSRSLAIQRFPELADSLKRKKDGGKADALWMLLWLEREIVCQSW